MEMNHVVSRANFANFDHIETVGQRLNAGSLKSLFFNQWRKEIRAGRVAENPKLKRRVAFYLATGVADSAEKFAAEIKGHRLMTTADLPDD